MRNDLTDVTLVVDRSGSMEEIRLDAEGGVNAFIKEQCEQPGECALTIVQFDKEYEFLCKGIPIDEADRFKLVPRGMTALLDAIGRAINETDERISKLHEKERPGLVVFVVLTDGYENASQEYCKKQIKKLIEAKQETGWQFTFLAADQDAFAEGRSMGMRRHSTANFSKEKVGAAWKGTVAMVSRMRGQLHNDDTIDNAFTVEEREEME